MDTLLKTHNKLEFLHPLHGFAEKLGNLTFPKLQNQEFRFGPKKSNLKWGRNGCVKASSSALLELVPETKKENLEFELPMYDPSKGLVVDLAVVGGGPAGLAVAQQVSEAGLSVCSIDPSPKLIWPNNYEVEEHPFDVDKMVFMDWRDSHLNNNMELKNRNSRIPTFLYAMPFSSNRIFLEETSLVARPGVPMEDIQERMVARLRHLGIKVKSIEEDERCIIPMGGPLPVLPQRVVGIGGTAGMVHPSTGYMVARTLAAAPIVANSIVQYLGSDRSFFGNELSSEVWRDLWPIERRRQREFFCFGMDILLKLDLQGTRRFFDAFFDLEPRYWHGFLSSRLFLPELIFFGLSLFSHASNTSRIEIMAKGSINGSFFSI
ncbi:unnamed protein product, partial [Vitis vinifera]